MSYDYINWKNRSQEFGATNRKVSVSRASFAESLSALAFTIWNMRSSLSWFAALCLEIRSVSLFSFSVSFLISLNFFPTSFCLSLIWFCPLLISTISAEILLMLLILRLLFIVTFTLCLQSWEMMYVDWQLIQITTTAKYISFNV